MSKPKPFYIKFDVGAFWLDTDDLTTQQVGAYIRILMSMWRSRGSAPFDPKYLARITKVHPAQWPKVWAALAPYFIVEDGRLTQKRLRREMDNYMRSGEDTPECTGGSTPSDAQGGALGVAPSEVAENIDACAVDSRGGVRRGELELELEGRKAPKGASLPSAREDEFGDWWSVYPRKIDKARSAKAYDRARTKASANQLLAALIAEKSSRQWLRDGGQFIPHPSTWLNNDRWTTTTQEVGHENFAAAPSSPAGERHAAALANAARSAARAMRVDLFDALDD